MQSRPVARTSRWQFWLLFSVVALVTLAPWWRNHSYLRSFFDYGVPMGAAGRLAEGQRPYVDFITPTQAGWFWVNRIIERVGDGTFQAMTRGGAICTVVSLAVLLGMLSRRWPVPVAAAVVGALLCGTVAQHTLFWYNPWGVVLLIVMAWAGAIAPVLRRKDWGWHLLAATALFLGGINKINMQLMAVGLAVAWSLRAGLTGTAGWGRVGLTCLYYIVCLVLPVLAEMAVTGASFATWWHNVVALPAATRTSMLWSAFSRNFLVQIPQDYYGPMLLQPIVPYGLVTTVLTVAAILNQTWREANPIEKVLPVVAGAAAFVGGAMLLTTNMDIAYIGLAGWLALLVALWLGYGLAPRGVWFYGGLVLPIVVAGTISWLSAWRGQRSQFGHSFAARESYVDGAAAGPDFSYLRGTRLPPETVESLRQMGNWRRSLSDERRQHHYYGPGTEWAAHVWPTMRLPGFPFYMQAGSSFGSVEMDRIYSAMHTGALQEITVMKVLDIWPPREYAQLRHRYEEQSFGEVFAVYHYGTHGGVSNAPIWFTRLFGGNADSRRLASDAEFMEMSQGRMFLGVTHGAGRMVLTTISNRVEGEVVLRRLQPSPRVPLSAKFLIYAQAGEARFERWSRQVELAADQDEVVVPYAIDSSHLETLFTVELPANEAGIAAAGWRGPRITHTGEGGPAEPTWLFHSDAPAVRLDEPALAALLPANWRPLEAFMRNGRLTADGLELSPGGEIWLRVGGIVTAVDGVATIAPGGIPPMVRSMWYGGSRLEVFTETPVRSTDHTMEFRAWCAEPGGWLVLAVDPLNGAAAARLKINQITAP
jgi:hypothetical protein